MRINHNTLALNAWRNLTSTNDAMSKSLEKLSSGYRINRAADDPAGLVISEKLRAEITGVDQAVNNTQDAVSMIQVAEGSLVEINTMLNSMRALALHAANTGASSTAAVAADQEQVDSAVNSIASIASNTSYLGRKLLNGNSGNTASILNVTNVGSVKVGLNAASGTNRVQAQVTTSATKAEAVTNIAISANNSVLTGGSFTLNGKSITLAAGLTASAAVDSINSQIATLGIAATARLSGAAGTMGIAFTANAFGNGTTLVLDDQANHALTSGTAVVAAVTNTGTNVQGTINGSAATGNGLKLTADPGTVYEGMEITLNASGNVAAAAFDAVLVTKGAVTFQIGSSASEKQIVSLKNVGPDQLGVSQATGGLTAIKSTGAYNLSTDPAKAVDIIDAAIDDISKVRADLGALTKNVFETKVRSLEISRENLTSSESRIRDVDMAKEMMEFTRNQIMTQAGTAMLAQANTAPQAVLKLLG